VGQSVWDVKLTSHRYVVAGLNVSGAILPLPKFCVLNQFFEVNAFKVYIGLNVFLLDRPTVGSDSYCIEKLLRVSA
jgi:hypothetical protein